MAVFAPGARKRGLGCVLVSTPREPTSSVGQVRGATTRRQPPCPHHAPPQRRGTACPDQVQRRVRARADERQAVDGGAATGLPRQRTLRRRPRQWLETAPLALLRGCPSIRHLPRASHSGIFGRSLHSDCNHHAHLTIVNEIAASHRPAGRGPGLREAQARKEARQGRCAQLARPRRRRDARRMSRENGLAVPRARYGADTRTVCWASSRARSLG